MCAQSTKLSTVSIVYNSVCKYFKVKMENVEQVSIKGKFDSSAV